MDPQGPVQLSFWLSDNARQEKLPFCKSKSGSVISQFIWLYPLRYDFFSMEELAEPLVLCHTTEPWDFSVWGHEVNSGVQEGF